MRYKDKGEPIYKIVRIGNKTVHVENTNDEKDQKDIPKYRMPLEFAEDGLLTINEYGMYVSVE